MTMARISPHESKVVPGQRTVRLACHPAAARTAATTPAIEPPAM